MKRPIGFMIAATLPACTAQVLAQSAPATAAKLPFTISKDTTHITEPLRADGTVDYIAAINGKYGAGVTPDNNGFVLYLQVVGTSDAIVTPTVKDEFLRRCGITPVAPDTPVWQMYADYLTRTKSLHGDALTKATDVLTAARLAPWLLTEHEDLATFLKLREKDLDIISAAARRSKWWAPSVSSDGRSVTNVYLAPLGRLREMANLFCARANMRAKAGDFEGFWVDIATTKLLARKLANSPTLIERLVGIACDAMASNSVACVGASGILTSAEAKMVADRLDQMPKLPTVTEAIDQIERSYSLDDIQQMASGHIELLQSPLDWSERKSPTYAQVFGQVDQNSVDWNLVLKLVNDTYDEYLRIDQEPAVRQVMAEGAAMEIKFAASAKSTKKADGTFDLTRHPNESREDYSRRVVATFLIPTPMTPSGFWRSEVLLRRAVKLDAMTRVILAAAQAKAESGQWPKTLEELVPKYLKELPQDMYSSNEAEPFKYVIRNGSIRVYSVGENGKDDGGINDPATGKDDLGVGVP